MGLADGDVEFGGRLADIGGGEFDDKTFLAGGGDLGALAGEVTALGGGHDVQSEVAADAVLEMDDVIAFLQFGEIDVEQGAAGGGVRGLEAAGALHLVAAENFRVRDDDEFGGLKEKAARESAQGHAQGGGIAQAVFPPNLLEALAFAVVVAEEMDGVVLARPALQLLEKLAALSGGDGRLGALAADGAEDFQALEWQGLRVIQPPAVHDHVLDEQRFELTDGDGDHAAPRHAFAKLFPGNEEGIARRDLGLVTIGLGGQNVRLAQEKDGVVGEDIPGDWRWRRFCLLRRAEFAAGRNGDGGDFLAGDLGDGIEEAEGIELVAEEFEATGQGLVKGQKSRMPPRMETWPFSATWTSAS